LTTTAARAYDAESGLYYYRARYCDYSTGRFLQPDPTGYEDGINWYLYCGNNPILYVDPFGLDWFDNWANFWAGAADSLSFGATGVVRGIFGVETGVNRQSTAYAVGKWTEVGVEVVVTAGGAGLRVAAKKAARNAARSAGKATLSEGQKIVRGQGSKYLRGITREGIKHHINPLFGHPGGGATLFPTGGCLPGFTVEAGT
jgi:RHS repeat-associated protein